LEPLALKVVHVVEEFGGADEGVLRVAGGYGELQILYDGKWDELKR
jgi:hypothetical protein